MIFFLGFLFIYTYNVILVIRSIAAIIKITCNKLHIHTTKVNQMVPFLMSGHIIKCYTGVIITFYDHTLHCIRFTHLRTQ